MHGCDLILGVEEGHIERTQTIRHAAIVTLEMISQIQKIDPDIHTIILTAHNEAKFYEEAGKLGLEHYLCKPLTLEYLINALSTIYIDNI